MRACDERANGMIHTHKNILYIEESKKKDAKKRRENNKFHGKRNGNDNKNRNP